MRLLSLLALVLSPALAQLPNPVTDADRFDLTGVVQDAVTGKALAGAQVLLQSEAGGGGGPSTTTDDAGNFRFANVVQGLYRLSSSRADYAADDASSEKRILVSGTQPTYHELKLQPQAVLTGVVTDQRSRPLPRAQILVLRAAVLSGYRVFRFEQEARTDAQGRYRITGMRPGICYVAATAQPLTSEEDASAAFPITYAPNVTETETARAVDLRPGAEQQADIQLTSVHGFRVKGRVAGGGNVTISLWPPAGSSARLQPAFDRNYEASSGNYTLSRVPPGNYIVQAELKDANGRKYSGYHSVSITGADAAGIDVTVRRSPALTGTVRNSEPGANAEGALKSVRLEAGTESYKCEVQGTRFEAPSAIPPGSYRLKPELGANWFLESATQESRDVMHGRVMIAEEGNSPALQLTSNQHGGTIEATLTWPDTGHRVPARVLALQTNGSEMQLVADILVAPPNEPAVVRPALLGGLAPGNYSLYAFPEPVTVPYANPENLLVFEPLTLELRVESNQMVRAALKLALP